MSHTRKHHPLQLLLAALLVCGWTAARAQSTNYDELKVGAYTLPDPLRFSNGKPVQNARQWKRRRKQILTLFATQVYGHNPEAPKHTSYDVFEVDKNALGGKAIRKQVTVFFSSRKDGPKEDVLLYLPAAAHNPVSVILTLNFSGNQSVVNDPAVKLPTIWNGKTHLKRVASEESRGLPHGSSDATGSAGEVNGGGLFLGFSASVLSGWPVVVGS